MPDAAEHPGTAFSFPGSAVPGSARSADRAESHFHKLQWRIAAVPLPPPPAASSGESTRSGACSPACGDSLPAPVHLRAESPALHSGTQPSPANSRLTACSAFPAAPSTGAPRGKPPAASAGRPVPHTAWLFPPAAATVPHGIPAPIQYPGDAPDFPAPHPACAVPPVFCSGI